MENGSTLGEGRRRVDTNTLRKVGEVKWRPNLERILKDLPATIFGGWIIWKQVYSADPNAYLALIGFACMFPAARSAITTILSTPGSSQRPPEPPEEPSSASLPPGGSSAEGKPSV
jgi:hypothetical protein